MTEQTRIEVVDSPLPLVTWARNLRWSADVYQSLFDDEHDDEQYEHIVDGGQSIHLGVGDEQYVVLRDHDGMLLDGYRVTETEEWSAWRDVPGSTSRPVYRFDRLDDDRVDALLDGLFAWRRRGDASS